MYVGYNVLEQLLIKKELQADLQAEQDYLASLESSRLSARTKQALMTLSEQNKNQLQQAAQSSSTLQEFHQKKDLLLEQWEQENKLETILAKEQRAFR